MSQPCTWCGTEFEPQGTGQNNKKFCSESCRRDFHAACRIWGEEQHGCGEVSIFQLRTCLGRRAWRTRHHPSSEGAKAPETGPRTDGALRGTTPMVNAQ